MNKEAIATGSTIEEAKKTACNELGADEADVQFELLQTPEKKKLGLFGGTPAKVRAYIEINSADQKNLSNTDKTSNLGDVINVSLSQSESEDDSALKNSAKEYLLSILHAMGVKDVNVSCVDSENGLKLNIEGEDIGFVIGRRGETLDALQCLVGLVANKHHDRSKYIRVIINVGGYREKREKTLIDLANRLSAKAKKQGRKISVEPMNAYDRRIVHTALQDIEGVISKSEGEGFNRHILIIPDKTFRSKSRLKSRKNNNSFVNDNSGTYDKIIPGETSRAKKQQTDQKIQSFDEDPVSPLYGKIDFND